MEPLMASNKHPWLILSLFFFSLFSSIPTSFSQSPNPQNIQVFFPFEPIPIIPPSTPIQPISPPPSPPLPPLSPPPSLPLSPPEATTSNTTSRRSVGTAVGVTAASTIVLSALFFLLLMRHRKRKREKKERVYVNPYSDPYGYGQNRVNPGLNRDQFVRFEGNVKGVIVDEEGLDVLYWRKLEGVTGNGNGVAKTNFNKEILKNTARDVREEKKKMVESASVSDRRKRLSESPVQEIPLLRGKSANSEVWPQKENGKSQIHNLMAEGKPELISRTPATSLPPPPSAAISRPAPPPVSLSVAAVAVSRPLPPPLPMAVMSVAKPEAPPPPMAVMSTAKPAPPPPPPPRGGGPASSSKPPPQPPMGNNSKNVNSTSEEASMAEGGNAPPPPPPPRGGGPASSSKPPPPPPMGNNSKKVNSTSEEASMAEGGNGQVKLKPLHWDKVNPNVEHSMVWHKMEKGSFKFDGDLMEALFGTVAAKKSPQGNPNSTSPKGDNKSGPPSKIFILDTRKSQNIAIVLKSLAISRTEIIDSLVEGQGLTIDTLEKLARIAPTKEEESAILEFEGDSTRLADAESFLFHILKAVPTAFSRFNAMLFKSNYASEISHLKDSLQTLESACKELRNRGLFVKLLEAILKAGNRMNAGTSRGNAQAFNLSSLLKLSDVKSSDGKTTLLHFVVEEVVRSEGKRCMLNRNRSLNRSGSRGDGQSESQLSNDQREKDYIMLGLPVVGGVSSEFSNVKKAASIDYDTFSKSFSALTTCLVEIKVVVEQCNGDIVGPGRGFVREMEKFLEASEKEIKAVKEEEKRVMDTVKNTNEYYQAKASSSKDKGGNFQLFIIVKEFLGMVDKTCVEIAVNLQKRRPERGVREREPTPASSSSPRSPARPSVKFPVLPANFMSDSSKSSSSDSDED